MNTPTTLKALMIGTALALGSTAADASPDWRERVVSSVGEYIAAQGNRALKDIRSDLRSDVLQRLQPITPEQPAATVGELNAPTARASR